MANLLAPPAPIEADIAKIGPNVGALVKQSTYDDILKTSPMQATQQAFDAGSSLISLVQPKPVKDPALVSAPGLKPVDFIRPLMSAGGQTANVNTGLSYVGGPLGKGAPGIAQTALKFLGVPYVWGGESPSGFDCSGLLQYAAAQNGIHISRTTYTQWNEGRAVGLSQLEPGDAVFFKGSDSVNGLPGHVGIYIGHGQFVEAAYTGAPVRISRLAGYPGYMGARRYGR